MKLNLVFRELKNEMLLKENITYCKLEFGNNYNPIKYSNIREIANASYDGLKLEDLKEQEDVLKNKLVNIQNSDMDNIMIGGLTLFGVLIASISKILPDYDKLDKITATQLTLYILFVIISGLILFILISYNKKVKTIKYTFYNLCFEELQKVKRKKLAMNDAETLLQVVTDTINSNDNIYDVEIQDGENIKRYNIKVNRDTY